MTTTALVTGANRGLGYEVARQLALSGATTLLGARDARRGDAAAARLRAEGLDVHPIALDVTSPASIREAAGLVRERHGRLDILVNNAGVLPEAAAETAEAVSLRMFRETYATNLFGAVAVIEEFLPLLREAGRARIVNVSSTMGSLADQGDPESPYYGTVVPAYQSSKAALNGLTVALAKLLAGTPITVNSVCPGWVQTDLAPGNREVAPMTPADAATVVVTMATAGSDGPTGSFSDREGAVAW